MPERDALPDQSDTPPTVVSFDVEKGQVWIDPDGTSWYVTSVSALNVVLERTVVETRPTRDLVLMSRRPNETHPLHSRASDEKPAKESTDG